MKIKKIIFFVLLSLICIEKGNTEIIDALFMTVGNKPITKSDIVNEIKIILILNNESYSVEKMDELHQIAVNSIIKRSIKQIEIEKNTFLKFNNEDLEKKLTQLAINLNMDLDTLKNICASNALDFLLIENQIKTELFWNSLIFELYRSRIKINSEEIEERLKLMQNKEKIDEYLISEILIKPVEKNDLESEIEKLKNKIKIEGFENIARKSSISESSVNGGDLGWLNENIISKKIKSAIISTAVGALSEAILLPEGILIFKINDKRKIKNTKSLEEIKNELVNAEKLKILNMYSLSHYDKLRRSFSVKIFNE